MYSINRGEGGTRRKSLVQKAYEITAVKIDFLGIHMKGNKISSDIVLDF